MRYCKRPVEVDAIQLLNGNIEEVYAFIYGAKTSPDDYESKVKLNGMDIFTLEDGQDGRAKHVASIGDWIIKGVKGEFYPCKPDIFAMTYERVEQSENPGLHIRMEYTKPNGTILFYTQAVTQNAYSLITDKEYFVSKLVYQGIKYLDNLLK